MEQNREPLLQITGLTHAFGGLTAVSDFNFTLDKASVWGIIGPNGAGKSTVFNLISGVYKPEKGDIIFKGDVITGKPSHFIVAKGISRTFQNIRLFKSMTVLDNVKTAVYASQSYPLWSAMLHNKHYKLKEKRITETACELLDSFGLASRKNEIAASLPYGLQRKVELCRALVSGPSILLLDEPGAGMNPSELDELADLILRVKKSHDVAIVLIEHRMRLVTGICDFVKVLNFGETIFMGKPQDLGNDAAVVKAYFGENNAASFN